LGKIGQNPNEYICGKVGEKTQAEKIKKKAGMVKEINLKMCTLDKTQSRKMSVIRKKE